MSQTLYETVCKLTSDEQEANRLYNQLYRKHHEEESSESSKDKSYSFVDKDLSALAEKLSKGESSALDRSVKKLSAYKEMFLLVHGSLSGAFDPQQSPDKNGEIYSEEMKAVLGEENPSMENPILKGYLLGVGKNPKVKTPYPLDFELTDDSVEETVVLSDPDVVKSLLPDQEPKERGNFNVLSYLSSSQVSNLSEKVESFDFCSDQVELNFPDYLKSSIHSYCSSLSEEDVASYSLSHLLLSHKLAEGQKLPFSILREEVKTIGEEEKSLIGGDLGYRYITSQLRLLAEGEEPNSGVKEESKESKESEESKETFTLNDNNKKPSDKKVDPASLEMFVDPDEEAFQNKESSKSDTYNLSENVSEDSSHVLKVSGFKVLNTSEREDGKKLVRVPIAVLGEWYHPEYKKVVFNQQDFDEMVQNFRNREAGYEPPLFVGHENPNNERVGGQPAVGYLQELFQEGNVLLGDFEMVDDKVYTDISDGKFRYASAEYAKNAVSKESSKKMGTFLAGSALTNRPHLTGMPRVKALSESNPGEITFDISQGESMPEDKTQETPEKEQNQEGQLSDSQFQEFRDLTKRIEQLEEKLTQKDKRIEQLESAHNESKKERKLEKLKQLTLSEDTKTKYRDMVDNDRLSDEQFDEVYEMLAEVASTQLQQLTSQVGSTSETDEENKEPSEGSDDTPDPYSNIIDRNLELIEKRKKSKQEELYSV